MSQMELFDGFTHLSSHDQAQLSRFGRGQRVPVPSPLVHHAFERIVETHPNLIAARFGDKSLTYQQLDIASNRLANHLISSGLLPRQRVCLVVQRSLEMLVGIMAILKAGCQYVPIDGGVASDQALEHIFNDTGARFVLCLSKFWDRTRRFTSRNAIIIAFDMDTGAFYSSGRPIIATETSDGAYAIYTSGMFYKSSFFVTADTLVGSTGKPKGVDVSHRNVTNALLLEPARLGITVGSKVAQVLSIAFDMGKYIVVLSTTTVH